MREHKGYRKDLTGKTFCYFTVLGFSKDVKFKSGKKGMWNVRCRCGKEKTVRGDALLRGNSRSCGCAQREWMRKAHGTGIGDLTGSKWCMITHNAKARGHKVTLTKKQASELFEKQGKKCALSGIDLVLDAPHDSHNKEGKIQVTASLDRIDSNGDYELGNVQWIHKDINRMKNDLPEIKFLEWIKKIYLFNFN